MYLSEYYCFTSVRVTYRIDTKKDVKLSCYCSLHNLEAPENGLASRNEQRRKPHADMLKRLTHLMRIGIRIHQGSRHS
jgi:hypothetical protein